MSNSSKHDSFMNTKAFLLELNSIFIVNRGDFDKIKIDPIRRKHHVGYIPREKLRELIGHDVTDDIVREFRSALYEYEKNNKTKRQQMTIKMEVESVSDKKPVCYLIPKTGADYVRSVANYIGKSQSDTIFDMIVFFFENYQFTQKQPPLIK